MPDEPDAGGARRYTGAGGNIDPGFGPLRAQVDGLRAAIRGVEEALRSFSQSSYSISENINRHLNSIGETAAKVAGQVNLMGASVGGGGAGAGGGGGGGGGGPGWINRAQQAAIAGTGTAAAEGMSNMAMTGLNWLRDRTNKNRQVATTTSGAMGMIGFAQNQNQEDIMRQLSYLPGNIRGSVEDIVQLFSSLPRLGASYNFGGGIQGVRAAGMLKGVSQMQMLNPTATMEELAGTVGGQAANTKAQQTSVMLTGGAMSMIGAGGRQKSLQEWAEGVLRWLEGLRPGGDRGKPFSYGQLMAQYFPGSNIDAWFESTGVSQGMRDYWWTYALGKAQRTGGTGGDFDFTKAMDQGTVAQERLKAASVGTQHELEIAGKMAGNYSTRERSNAWFNNIMGGVTSEIFGALDTTKIGKLIAFLPDAIEDGLMKMLSNMMGGAMGMLTGGLGSLMGGGGGGLGGILGGGMQMLGGAVGMLGDTPDVGDYGAFGGTSTAGLHPDLQRKIKAMQSVNPRIRITSGLRDTGLQRKLKERGFNRVSGKPSAHTRGLAADLGPRSEYAWIAENANKFGLASGQKHGEPWHVGMPGDVGDLFGSLSGLLTGGGDLMGGLANFLLGLIGGGDTAGGIKSLSEMVVGSMTGGIGNLLGMKGKGTGLQQTKFDPSLFDKLTEASKDFKIGMSPISPLKMVKALGGGLFDAFKGLLGGAWDAATGLVGGIGGALGIGGGGALSEITGGYTPGGVGQVGTNPPGGTGTVSQFMSEVLAGLGAPGTQNNILKLSALAKYEGNKSGKYNPFNSVGGDFPNKFNSVGVENYPDWKTGVQYTTKLLSQANTAGMRSNLQTDAGYDTWRGAVSSFYKSWGGPNMPNISQNSASDMAGHQINMGDVGDVGGQVATALMTPSSNRGALMQFNNTFQIGGGMSGGSYGGIDARRTATLIADHLEDEMKQRAARNN